MKDKIHKEILKDAINGEDKDHSTSKKIGVFIAAMFLLLLMLTYFVGGPHTIDIIESMLTSSKMDHFVLEGDDFSVMFESEAYEELKDIYFDIQDREFKACLGGEISGNNYLITEILLPDQRGSYAQVTYTQCPAETIVSLHSHPYRRCRASGQDFESFEEFRITSPDAVMMVMCEVDRFYVYR